MSGAAAAQTNATDAGTRTGRNDVLVLNDDLRAHFSGDDAFDRIMQLDGKVYRRHKHRRTIRVAIGGRHYFVKIHEHSGFGEILKNLSHCRLPILTARPEYDAIARLRELGVPTMTVAGFGVCGRNPARLRSFIITEELSDTESLEHLVPHWNDLPAPQRGRLRKAAIDEMGRIAQQLHEHGINHRDFYLCHFLTKRRNWASWQPSDGMELSVIDLHRMQMRSTVPMRWRVKDLAGLLHSSLDEHPTAREMLRFWRAYRGAAWKHELQDDRSLVTRVNRRALRQYRARHGTPPPRAGMTSSSA